MPDHRLHRYEVLHNKLSGLEELPVDCNPVEIQSVFHNPLVELAVDVYKRQVTHGLLLAFGIGALLNLLSLLIMKPYFGAFTNKIGRASCRERV